MADCCCGGNGKVRLIYACSGAANTGFLADPAAADENFVLDGCPVSSGADRRGGRQDPERGAG